MEEKQNCIQTPVNKGTAQFCYKKQKMENLHPVYYMSKKTNTAEEKYDSYELEVLAIINALKKFRVYLLGQPFKIVTDCSAFQKTMQKKELITRIARWALQLEEFDYEIEHRAGSRMKHVDALSRYPVMMVCNDTLTSKLKNAQEEDDNIQTLKSLLEKQESEEFLSEMVYSTTNKKTGKKEGFLNPISKESIPLSTYHVDFIGPLPSTNKNYQHIFTVVDAFTKFTWLYPVKTLSAESALEKLNQQQKTFCNPIRIISDRGSAFTSKLFNDYCDEENIQHLQIATGVPRGNGQVERIHRTLIPVLTKLSLDDSTKWYKYVDRLQRILNSTISRSTKWTPFELLVGIKMRNKEDILIKDLLLEEMAKELLEQREFLRNDAKRTSKPYSLKIERRITEEEKESFVIQRRYELFEAPADDWGTKVNNSWRGAIGMILRGEADMIPYLTVTPSRYEVIEFTKPVAFVRYGLLIAFPGEPPRAFIFLRLYKKERVGPAWKTAPELADPKLHVPWKTLQELSSL
ncbi:hypothetical protein TNCV_1806361 [Trichonephila clavipes]|nr:hypothetical protein TNCV_1806361 [Trichonephila clavipes]